MSFLKSPVSHLQTYFAVKGNEPENFEAAYQSGADAVVFDLDKPVQEKDKKYARQAVSDFLNQQLPLPTLVRVNGPDTPHTFDDLDAVIKPSVTAIRLPRIESATWIREVASFIDVKRIEREIVQTIGLEVYPGTAKGLKNLDKLAIATHTVWRLGLGEESLYQSVGSSEDQAMLLARLQTVQSTFAANLPSPVQKSFIPHWSDEYLKDSSMLGLNLGFGARTLWKNEHVHLWKEIYQEFLNTTIRTASGQR